MVSNLGKIVLFTATSNCRISPLKSIFCHNFQCRTQQPVCYSLIKMSVIATNAMPVVEKDIDLSKEKQLRKIFFMKFTDIKMINQGSDVKPESKASPCRYLNGKMYNVNGDMYKLQIYFKHKVLLPNMEWWLTLGQLLQWAFFM